MKQKLILLTLLCCLGPGAVFAQHKDSIAPVQRDSGRTPAKVSGAGTHLIKKDSGDVKGAVPEKTLSAGQGARDSGRQLKTATTSSTDSLKPKVRTSAQPAASKAAHKDSISAGTDDGSQTGAAAVSGALAAAQPDHRLRDKLATEALSRHSTAISLAVYFPKSMFGASDAEKEVNVVQLHDYSDRDYLFFAFLGISLLLGLIKMLFPRYFNQIFWFFLHPNDRKKQLSDQMNGQNILPSLLLNLFFALTGGLFLAQIVRPSWPGASFWRNWLLFTLVLVVVYFIKFLVIRLSGWLFNSPVAASTYNNVVFSINKVIGLLLLPATLLIAYGSSHSTTLAYSFSIIIIVILLIYRYIASFLLIKGKLKVNAFHFILYLCAVEIIPLLLVYKVLFSNIGQLI